MDLVIYTDGGSRNNPGPAASSFVVYQNKKEIYRDSVYIGTETNNIAEYKAVLLSLQYIVKNILFFQKLRSLSFFSDSLLLVNQLNGLYKIKNTGLKPLFHEIKKLEEKINAPLTYTYIPREKNSVADALVNEELDKKGNKLT